MKQDVLHYPLPEHGGDIYELVQRLDASEKAIVRKFWTKATGSQLPLHVRLFNEIAAGKVTRDSAARAQFGDITAAQLSNLKQQLLGDVLEALALAGRERSPRNKLHLGIMQLRELEERCHWQLARRLCKKLLTIAEYHGLYIFALELLFHRSRLADQRNYQLFEREQAEVTLLIERFADYRRLAQQIRFYCDRLALLRTTDQFLSLPASQQLVAEASALLNTLDIDAQETPHLRLRFLACMALIHYMLQKHQACSACTAEVLALLEARPDMAQSEHESLLLLANISCYNGFARGKLTQVEECLRRFNSLAAGGPKSRHFRKQWRVLFFHNTLKIAHKKADYDGVAALIDREAQSALNDLADAVAPLESLAISTSIVISLFVLERFDAAEELLLVLKERNRSLARDDIFYFTLIFHLLILFELKDWRRLASASEAAYQALYKRRQLRPFERELMSLLKSLPARRSEQQFEPLIRAFLPRLDQYRNDPKQRMYLLFFNYYDWLQSKLAGLSYREYKRRLIAASPSQAS
jgi:hypothetical protein